MKSMTSTGYIANMDILSIARQVTDSNSYSADA